MTRSLSREFISTKREKIAKLARIEPKLVLTTLAHHIDVGWLREAYRRTRKDGAAGVDGVTATQYETNREANLASLLERFKTGSYRAPAVRRVYIPKEGAGNKTRPIGIPTLEDKVLQRAVVITGATATRPNSTAAGTFPSLDRQVVVHLKSGIVCYTKWRAVYREIRQRKWDAPDFGASLKDDVTRRGVDGLP